MKEVTLTDVEISHIEHGLKRVYNNEWCSCCERIAHKLGFIGLDQKPDVLRMTQDE